MTRFAAAVLVLLMMSAACGTSAPPVTRWQGGMETWFANGSVRPPEPPRPLWARDDEDLLQKRIGFADVVLLGRARVATLFTMLGAPGRIALAFSPDEVLHGTMDGLTDEQGELLLPIASGDLDFQLALRVFDHLPGSRYLLLLKRRPGRGSASELRWALYKPDRQLIAEIRAMFHWLEQKKAGE